MDLIENLGEFVEENLFLLAPVDQAWQPTDYLPDLTSDNWARNLAGFRESAQRVSDDLLVILVGNLITEGRYQTIASRWSTSPGIRRVRPRLRGHAGSEAGPRKRIGMAISSTPIFGSRGVWICAPSNAPFTT